MWGQKSVLLENLLQDFHLLLLQLGHHINTISETLWKSPCTHRQHTLLLYFQIYHCLYVCACLSSLPFLSLMTLRAWSCSSMFFWTIMERKIWKSSVAKTGWNTDWKTKTTTCQTWKTWSQHDQERKRHHRTWGAFTPTVTVFTHSIG